MGWNGIGRVMGFDNSGAVKGKREWERDWFAGNAQHIVHFVFVH